MAVNERNSIQKIHRFWNKIAKDINSLKSIKSNFKQDERKINMVAVEI